MTESAVRGERLFHGVCAQCHRPDSERPLNGPGLKGVFQKKYLPSGAPATDAKVRETIMNGRKNMPALGFAYDARQIDDIIAYLHTL